jgi:hypothetical protein
VYVGLIIPALIHTSVLNETEEKWMLNNTDLQRAYIKMGGLFPKILATNSKTQTHISTAPPSGIVL